MRLQRERDALKERLTTLAMDAVRNEAARQQGEEARVAVASGLDTAGLPKAASLLAEGARYGLALLPREEGGWRFALCAHGDPQETAHLVCELCGMFGGRGGGGGGMAQGQLDAGTPEELRAALTRNGGEAG